MLKTLRLVFVAVCTFTYLQRVAHAQDLLPIIQLSADETAKAKQLAQDLKNARERNAKAQTAWQTFHLTYQTAHPGLGIVRFTSNFRLACSSSGSDVDPVKVVELTAEERQQLQALHRELVESEESRKEAQETWIEYQYQIVADHASSIGGTLTTGTLSTGKTFLVPAGWSSGLAFTPDFRFAVPHF